MPYPHRISVAPMMGYTDSHLRYLFRLITRQTLLYTEMLVCDAILKGDCERLLAYHPAEHPLSLQVGGNEPKKLEQCAIVAEKLGYDEINFNAGCPSDRVQQGRFGACLMKEPELVRDCLLAMQQSVKIPVTLKTRIGVDELDNYKDLTHFIQSIMTSGCQTIILHARKAWLSGLSPKENRTIPPLRHEFVYQLKKDFPDLTIILNGGLKTVADIEQVITKVDGVMIGRQACSHPYLFAEIDRLFYQDIYAVPSRQAVILHMIPYIKEQLAKGVRLNSIARHLLGLFYGTKHAKQWRRYLSEHMHKPDAGSEVILGALEGMNDIVL